VHFQNSEDCWIKNCRIVNSGTHPLLIERSKHISVLDSEIRGAHNKGGKGAGYVNITRSQYVLLDRVTLKDLRHLSIQNADEDFPCRYNVIRRCHLFVDVNFHNGDSGQNLVEDCLIFIPEWHWWHPISHGVPNHHAAPGPRNFVHRCRISRVYPAPHHDRSYSMATDPQMVYVVIDDLNNKEGYVRNLREFERLEVDQSLYRKD
jgi:hypothetical protein